MYYVLGPLLGRDPLDLLSPRRPCGSVGRSTDKQNNDPQVLTTGTEGILGVWDPSLGGFRESSTDSQIPGNRELMNPDPKYMRLSEHREWETGCVPTDGGRQGTGEEVWMTP